MNKLLFTILIACSSTLIFSQDPFNGLDVGMNNLFRLSDAKTRSISPENYQGEKGKGGMATLEEGSASNAARDLGQGWKVNPYVRIQPGETFTVAEIEGSGAIQHIWMTPAGKWRYSILRFYWDNEKEPSVEVPVGDFFAAAYEYKQISSLAVCVNPGSAFNCYWIMPFKKKCRITMENIGEKQFPTICGTGTEDYFCGSYGFVHDNKYKDYTTPYAGFHVIEPDDNVLYKSQTRFGMYRWHITDPIRFDRDLKVTMQALGWRSGGRYLPLQDDIASVAFWYQSEPHNPFPKLPEKDYLEIQ
jgi:hypothetical protein